MELTPELFRQIWHAASCSANRSILDATSPDSFLNSRLKEVLAAMKAAPNGERPSLLVGYLADWGVPIADGKLWESVLASLETDVEYRKCIETATRMVDGYERGRVTDRRKAIDEFKGATNANVQSEG